MVRFFITRLLMSFLTLVLVSLVVFSLMELVPGDCAVRYLAYKTTQSETISEADIQAERERLGLDRPFLLRWASWVSGAFLGDFGKSCILRLDIARLLGGKFWLSLAVCLGALLLAYLVAVPVGIMTSASRSAVLDNGLRFLSYLGLAIPNFLLALLIMLFSTVVFGETFTGLFSPEYRDQDWSWGKFVDLLKHIWLPIFILGWSATAFALQTVRALMSDEVGKLYVMAAKARGVDGSRLLWRYPARHALGPIIGSLGFDLNRVFNELPVVALVLTLTDAGALLIDSLAKSNDQQLAGAIIFLLTAVIVFLNFVTDVALIAIDPRARRSILGQ